MSKELWLGLALGLICLYYAVYAENAIRTLRAEKHFLIAAIGQIARDLNYQTRVYEIRAYLNPDLKDTCSIDEPEEYVVGKPPIPRPLANTIVTCENRCWQALRELSHL